MKWMSIDAIVMAECYGQRVGDVRVPELGSSEAAA